MQTSSGNESGAGVSGSAGGHYISGRARGKGSRVHSPSALVASRASGPVGADLARPERIGQRCREAPGGRGARPRIRGQGAIEGEGDRRGSEGKASPLSIYRGMGETTNRKG
jgi:hypothetical protein